jgi:hypothetical protein
MLATIEKLKQQMEHDGLGEMKRCENEMTMNLSAQRHTQKLRKDGAQTAFCECTAWMKSGEVASQHHSLGITIINYIIHTEFC